MKDVFHGSSITKKINEVAAEETRWWSHVEARQRGLSRQRRQQQFKTATCHECTTSAPLMHGGGSTEMGAYSECLVGITTGRPILI